MRNPITQVGAAARTAGTRRSVVVMTAIVIPLVACLAMAWFGFSWYSAAHDDGFALAKRRDTVLQQATQVAINLNTLDSQHVQHGLTLWRQSTAGPLDKTLSSSQKRYKKIISQSNVSTKATVRDAAVQQLHPRKHTAVVLVGVDVTVTPAKGKPSLKRERLKLTMTRTPQGWKASRVQAVQA